VKIPAILIYNRIMTFTRAITRTPGTDFARGITTSTHLGTPDYARLLDQHAAYIGTLHGLGLQVDVLEPLPGYPDAYFVEDPAVVTPKIAVLTNPGAASRRGEVEAIRPALERYCQTARIEPPGTLEGGDVLIVDRHVFIGISARTNQAGAAQLGRLLARDGYTWSPVPVPAGLHFKSSVNYVGKNTLLLTADFAPLDIFQAYEKIIVDPAEAYAANTLLVNDTLIIPQGFPETRKQLERLGLPIVALDASEARKMDGGLTCMSLRF